MAAGCLTAPFRWSKAHPLVLLGPKGAGKSTAVALLMGFIRPDVGTCQIGGRDCFRERQDIQARAGMCRAIPALPPRMTGSSLSA